MKVVIACRHGEAYKNLNNIYGGNGSELTEKGIKQVENLTSEIEKVVNYLQLPAQIYQSCNRMQVSQSASIIANKLHVPEVQTSSQFKPIRLGVFDGMSGEQRKLLYPEASKANEQWQQGLIDITEAEKLVEGSQSALNYYEQIKSFIDSLKDNSIHILLGTRSDMTCIYNVFMGQTPEKYMSYKCYNFDYAVAETQIECRGREKKVINIKKFAGIIDDKYRSEEKSL